MATPDVTPYVDLTLYDVDAQTIIERALADALVKLPGWQPREGNTEVVLVEALALEVAELVYAINRIPGAVLEVLLRLYGLTRDPGAPARAVAEFAVSDTAGHTIPAGARLLLPLPGGLPALEFTTDTELTIEPGADTGTVAITAAGTPTADGAGTPAGTALDVLDALPYVDGATLAEAVSGARDPEDGRAFLERGTIRLQRLVTTLVLPAHFTAAALEEPAVSRAFTVDSYDPGQAGDPGDHPGHVTIAVAGPDGVPVPAADKTALELALEEQALASLDVHVADATVTDVAVTVGVKRLVGADPAAVTAAVEAAVRDYLDPDAWPFAGTVWRNELVALIDRVAGVDRVTELAAPAADVALTGIGPLARAGVVTVTVTS